MPTEPKSFGHRLAKHAGFLGGQVDRGDRGA